LVAKQNFLTCFLSFYCILECTHHIAERHHAAIFFGLFFGVMDYIFTQFQPDPALNIGPYAMSRGSALSSMVWCGIIVYTVDRRWARAAIFCTIAAFFAGMGIIHQSQAVDDFRDGDYAKSTSPFEFMMGYFSLGGVCGVYWILQTYNGKKILEGEPGFKEDHGYLPPIEEPGVDDMFSTWWEPAERALAIAEGKYEDKSNTTKKVMEESSSDEGPDFKTPESEDVARLDDFDE
jgi:hypothetical protein